MGYTLPPPDSPREQVRLMSSQKQTIEAELEAQITILKANNSTLHSPLVDPDGFPRADIDIYAVRGARIRIIELRNDLEAIVSEIAKALEVVYAKGSTTETDSPEPSVSAVPFAKVNGVAPLSPAAEAGLQREDLIVKFGSATKDSVGSSIQALADVVASNEDKSIVLKVLRQGQITFLSLTPRKGWGGRGMLGCHIVPYSET